MEKKEKKKSIIMIMQTSNNEMYNENKMNKKDEQKLTDYKVIDMIKKT